MPRVWAGLERWLADPTAAGPLPAAARIGLLAHGASIDAEGRHAIELLGGCGAWRLERLFAPEHGLWGHEQDMERVASTRDPATGLPVTSLYGSDPVSLRPTRDDLRHLDALVCDLQDVGARYYTYVYTLSYVMEAAQDAGLPVVVLDRPNPIGGLDLEGPILDPALASFVGRYPLPVRHGLTIGELATLFNHEFGIGCDLRVVPLDGWRRRMQFDETGLPWVPPSPNLPSLAAARVYPGGCLVEGTNLSEGRGTTTPFEQIGAPWLDAPRLASALRDERLPGVRFRAASFRPMFQKHVGAACRGVQVIVSDPRRFRPFATYLVLLREARRQDPPAFAWRADTYEFEGERLAIDLLTGRTDIRERIESGAGLRELEATWQADAEAFCAMRRKYLVYR